MRIHLIGDRKTNRIWLNGELLLPEKSQEIINHSPDGFAWGYGGSGPSQLALAICLELYGQDKATQIYQSFKWDYIANLPDKNFDITLDIPNY